MKTVDKGILEQIDNYISENKEGIINDLFDLIRIPSVQSESYIGAPYGKACKQMLEETVALYKRHGFESQISSDNNYVLSFFGEGEKTVGLFAHGDVVPVADDWIVCKPFEPVIKDGYIFGRGCHDDKSGIIEALYATKIIRDLKLPFEGRIIMMTGSNEETGMADAASFKENEKMPDYCLVLDAEYPYYLGEKSSMKLDLTSKERLKTIKRIFGGKSYTTVLGEVTAEIEYLDKLFDELKENCKDNPAVAFEKRGSSVFVKAKGISGHVANIEKTLNAMVKLSEVLAKCESIPEHERDTVEQAGLFIGDGYGTGFGIDNNDGIFGKLTCGNGFVRTEEEHLVLGFDIRAGLTADLNGIHKQIIEVAKDKWNVDFKRASEGYYNNPDLPLAQTISKVYEKITGESGKKPILSTGGTYSRWLDNSFSIGTVVDLPNEHIALPDGHGEWHQPDEKLSIEGLLLSIKILVCILLELDFNVNG